MAIQKPNTPKGTRDFGPEQMLERNHIFNIIRRTFERFGYLPLETPAMENLSVLMGKYGDEGDKLLFKIVNSGDYLKKASQADFEAGSQAMLPKISEKGMKYDLTVPFARYVVQNHGELNMPFKRYQIQPVWRADRPQRGRYREFYQCDADVVGTDSLICEAEIIAMINSVLGDLGIPSFSIKINNRKVLTGITEWAGAQGKESDLCVAIDKLDKIGEEKVKEELAQRGFSEESIAKSIEIISLKGETSDIIAQMKERFEGVTEVGTKGLAELEEMFEFARMMNIDLSTTELDLSLARGLSYYTGAIFEVKANNVSIGSISGGGRYDDLTSVFGLKGVSGVGFSFGVDRIYDVMDELKLFVEHDFKSTQVIFTQFDDESRNYLLPILTQLRNAGISAEIYPSSVKMKKQTTYINNKKADYAVFAGSNEIERGVVKIKTMLTGYSEDVGIQDVSNYIIKKLGTKYDPLS